MKILLATNNTAKIKRFKQLLSRLDLDAELYTPSEAGIKVIDVEESGETLEENAELKARAYAGKTDMIILSNDTGFHVDGEGFVKAPKRKALGEQSENDMTSDEIAKKLLTFWKGVAEKHGGEVDATWIEIFVALYPNGEIKKAESKREVVLTNQEFGASHVQFPMRALYYSKTTNKPAILHTEEEEILELRPVTDALFRVLS